jgi:chemotaxis response regulator CheB
MVRVRKRHVLPMPFVDLLIDQMPPLTRALVDEAVAGCPGIRIVAQNVPAAELAAMVSRHAPEVVLLGSPQALGGHDAVARLLGRPRLPSRIITLFDATRGAMLVEWQHSVRRVEPLSAAALCRALSGRDDADG